MTIVNELTERIVIPTPDFQRRKENAEKDANGILPALIIAYFAMRCALRCFSLLREE